MTERSVVIPPDVERSLAICIRNLLEHTDTNDPISEHAERVDQWFADLDNAPERRPSYD